MISSKVKCEEPGKREMTKESAASSTGGKEESSSEIGDSVCQQRTSDKERGNYE